jgi:hypothetical protein
MPVERLSTDIARMTSKFARIMPPHPVRGKKMVSAAIRDAEEGDCQWRRRLSR